MSDDIFSEIPDTGHRENCPDIQFEEFKKVLHSRRSVRVYEKDYAVSTEEMNTILESALLAPNSSNLQPWEFHWAKSPEIKRKVVEACLSQPAAATASELIVCVARTKTWKKHKEMMLDLFSKEKGVPAAAIKYYQKIVPLAYEQGPFGILFPFKWLAFNLRGLFTPSPREPISVFDMKVWATKSTALACENMMLTARALGLDTCPMEGFDQKRVKKILGLASDGYPVMVISVGKRAENGVYGKQVRFDKNQFIFTH